MNELGVSAQRGERERGANGMELCQLCPIKRGLYREPFTLHLNLTGNGPKYHTGAIIAMLPSLKLAQYLAKETANECNYCVQRGAECHVS